MFPIRSFSSNTITDNLIGASYEKIFGQFVAAGGFFGNIGIEANVAMSPAKPSNRHDQFTNAVALKFQEKYYSDVSASPYVEEDPLIRFSIGPSYKFERGGLIFIGRMMIGAVSIHADMADARLKEKGTHELIDINWKPKSYSNDCFAINPSFTLTYRLSRKIALDFDVGYWQYTSDINYAENTKVIRSQQIVINAYKSRHSLSDISLGIGFMAIFW